MALSGDRTFDLSRDQVINLALANVGAIGPGKTATGTALDHAARMLNIVDKAIDADGKIGLWRVVERTQSLTAGTASYTLGTDVVEVEEPMTYLPASSATRSPIMRWSQDNYFGEVTDRTVQGRPSNFTLVFALPTTVTLYLWPTPNTTSDSVVYRAVLRASDLDTGANTADFPARWLLCRVYGLTAALAPAYGQMQLANQMQRFFELEKERQLDAGEEKGTVTLVPWGAY